MIHYDETNTKKATHSRLLSSGAGLLVLLSGLNFTHARYGTCGRSYHYGYPRRSYYNSHWNHWGGGYWNDSGSCGRRSCRRRHYNPVIDLFGELVDASMNSLARQERRRDARIGSRGHLAAKEPPRIETTPRYHLEDLGSSGLELSVEIPELKAHEIDLEISHTGDGAHTLSVRGSPGVHRRRSVTNPEISQSFVVDDDTIDVDGIDASLSSSGILTITMPRKAKRRTRVAPSVIKSLNEKSQDGDEILVFDAKRREFYGSGKRASRKPRVVGDTPRKTTASNANQKSRTTKEPEIEEDDDDGDDGLWISEAEDIW